MTVNNLDGAVCIQSIIGSTILATSRNCVCTVFALTFYANWACFQAIQLLNSNIHKLYWTKLKTVIYVAVEPYWYDRAKVIASYSDDRKW